MELGAHGEMGQVASSKQEKEEKMEDKAALEKTDERHGDERERRTMCRGRLRDSFRERCQRMQLTRSRFGASLRGKVGGRAGGGRR